MKKTLFIFSIMAFLLAGCTSTGMSSKSTKSNTTAIVAAPNAFTGANLRLIGRFDLTNGQAAFTWPGSAIEFRFKGTQASITVASQAKTRFIVSVDGNISNLWIEEGTHAYPLASNIANAEHTIRLTRVSESSAGTTRFMSDPIVDGALLTPPPAPQRRLLVIGDSISAGYGVEGAEAACHYALDTSNQQLTYAALAANALGADLHSIAWSGIGAWRYYGEKTPAQPTILVRSLRTLADDATSVWQTSQYVPNAVLVNIGTNDYWDGAVTEEYRTAMENLINRIKTDYPGKPIYLIVSPMLTNKVHDEQKQILSTLAKGQVKVLDLGQNDGSEGFGCDYHPNITTHTRLGKALEKSLKADLKW